jgi:hypothetical protein
VIDMNTIRQSRRKLVPVEIATTKRTFRVALLVLPNYDVQQEPPPPAPPAPKGDEKQSA